MSSLLALTHNAGSLTYISTLCRGAVLHCRLALWNPERFFASVYLVVGGVPYFTSKTDFDVTLPIVKQIFGAELIAYQEFFSCTPDAAQLLEKNVRLALSQARSRARLLDKAVQSYHHSADRLVP